jgi:hypothetical protein
MRCRLLGVAFLLVVFSSAPAATLTIPAARDTTLVEDSDGALSNGAGPAVFAGRTNALDNSVRRGLFFFELPETRLPIRAATVQIESVAVILTDVTVSNIEPREYRLHQVLADWGEGTSSSSGGGGANATPGDATWIHTFHGGTFWLHNGGQFKGEPSARLVVSGPGVYRFESDALLRDVTLWLREPDRNFGWILIGDETQRQTVRAFASRENPDPALRPVLEITYRNRP